MTMTEPGLTTCPHCTLYVLDLSDHIAANGTWQCAHLGTPPPPPGAADAGRDGTPPAVPPATSGTGDQLARALFSGEQVPAGQRRPVNTAIHSEGTPLVSRPTPHRTMPCCAGFVHDHLPGCALVAHVGDRRGARYEWHGESRSHPVPCSACSAPSWALDGFCDRCAVATRVNALMGADQ